MAATTDRRARCAELIAGGATVYDAMVRAGFGARFAAGNADTFAAFLTAKGYMKPEAAGRAKAGKPAPKAAESDALDDKE